MTEPVAPIERSYRRHSQTSPSTHRQTSNLPRVSISYCTQCKWMLRAAYFAQELLSTFGTTLGEVALVPATGGTFTVTILHYLPSTIDMPNTGDLVEGGSGGTDLVETLLWDRKTQGGFPDVKQLKALVRNTVDPTRSLGHVDRALDKANEENKDSDDSHTQVRQKEEKGKASQSQAACEDCN